MRLITGTVRLYKGFDPNDQTHVAARNELIAADIRQKMQPDEVCKKFTSIKHAPDYSAATYESQVLTEEERAMGL